MLMPSAISLEMAGTPSFVPGTLTMRFGRSISFQRSRACRTVASVLWRVRATLRGSRSRPAPG